MGSVFQDLNITNFSDFQIVIFSLASWNFSLFHQWPGVCCYTSNFLNKACNLKFIDSFQIFLNFFWSFSEFTYLYWPTKLFKCCRWVTKQNSTENKWIWTFFQTHFRKISLNFAFSFEAVVTFLFEAFVIFFEIIYLWCQINLFQVFCVS